MKLKELIASDYRVAAYSRLSRDDGKKGKKESMSIENQKRLLESYCEDKSRKWTFTHYSDDGWSGMNFNRPRFEDMMQEVNAKRINCVVVKCLDRLGRGAPTGDMIEALHRKKVRFIAISEGIDTLDKGLDDALEILDMYNMINGLYPKTVSRKVRQIKRARAEEGKFMNSRAAYGYMKDPADVHKLIIDEDAAKIIRRIFSERAVGDSASEIARRLTLEGIDCPDYYYYRKFKSDKGGVEPLIKRGKVNAWNATSISQNYLRNEVYIGTHIAGRREVTSIKDGKIEPTDKEDWIIIPNNHEPIITQKLWDEVHKLLNSKQRTYKTKETGEVSLFAGVLRCDDCGRPLAYTTKKLAIGSKGVYKCSGYNNNIAVCTTHYIDELALIHAILTDLQQYAVLATSEREKLSDYLLTQLRKSQSSDEGAINSQINRLDSRLLEIKGMLKSLYKDKIAGKLDEHILSELMDDCIKERTDIEAQLPKLRQDLANLQATASDIDEWLDKISECLEIRTLDRAIVTGLVDKIIVGEKVRVKGQPNTQEIQIYYRFIGDLLNPRNAKEDAASTANVLNGFAII